MSKRIVVIPSTGGALSDLTIEPGTTPRDVKTQLGLSPEYVLTRGKGSEPIPDDANLYESINDGSKLYSSTDVQWGSIAVSLSRLVNLLRYSIAPPVSGDNPRSRIPSVQVQPVQPAVTYPPQPQVPRSSRRRRPAIRVQRNPIPYWEERGWKRAGSKFEGLFQTRFGRWLGRVTVSPSGRLEVFIHNPPAALHRHPHWPCFHARATGWYFIHPTTPVRDVSAGILSVEKTIEEAYAI